MSQELEDLAGRIDHTLLRADATAAEIDSLCDEARRFHFACVCVHGGWVRRCVENLADSRVSVCAVVGFPLGAMATETKVHEARHAIQDGASEIDMVMNIGALKSAWDDVVGRDIAAVAKACHELDAKLKVILETALLSDPEKVRACEIAHGAGADFVKTSTGFAASGATAEDVALMRRVVGPTMGIKAAGGIRDSKTALAMIRAGATRLGTTASVELVRATRGSADESG